MKTFNIAAILLLAAVGYLFPVVAILAIGSYALVVTVGLKNTRVDGEVYDLASPKTVAAEMASKAPIGLEFVSNSMHEAYVRVGNKNEEVSVVQEAIGAELSQGFKSAAPIVAKMAEEHEAKMAAIAAEHQLHMRAIRIKYGVKA